MSYNITIPIWAIAFCSYIQAINSCGSNNNQTQHIVIDRIDHLPTANHVVIDDTVKTEEQWNGSVSPGSWLSPLHIKLDNADDIGRSMVEIDADTSCPTKRK